jgi:hypothetical protein
VVCEIKLNVLMDDQVALIVDETGAKLMCFPVQMFQGDRCEVLERAFY